MSTIEENTPRPNFLFDIIVTRLQLDAAKIDDPSAILVSLKFNSIPINITPSRINVSDFKAGRRTEFSTDPAALRRNLERAGMPVVVRYRGSTLGDAKITLPASFIDRVEVGMSDLVHADTCDLLRRNQVIGTLDYLCVLIIKCDEQPQDIELGPCNKSCGNLGKNINPADIMFMLSNSMPCPAACEPCLDELPPEEGDERLKLDLNRYEGTKERFTEQPKKVCGVDACCSLKTLTKEYEGLIDSVVKKVNSLPSPIADNPPEPNLIERRQEIKHKGMEHIIPVPVGNIEEMGIKPIRFCPVCLTKLTWLPKYANCPKCCAKAMPQIEQRPEDQPTANQIIDDVLKLPTDLPDDFCYDPCDQSKKKEPKDDCRHNCTCKFGLFCLHCRMRNLCRDSLKTEHVESKTCIQIIPKSDEDFCVIAEVNPIDPNDCRPYLEHVFSELRDLYDKKEKNKTEDLRKRCTQSLLRFGKQDDNAKLTKKDDNAELTKSSSPNDIQKATGGPTMLYRSELRKHGHKSCLKRRGNVSRRHGWAWTSSKEARKHGWRPGAICRVAGAIMRFFLRHTPGHKTFNICGQIEETERRKQPPILNVCKKDGNIFITLRAINSPHVQMNPIVFKVVKSDLAVALRQIKRKFKEIGFPKCTCHNTVMMCTCRSPMEKKLLERALLEECHKRRIVNCVDHLVLTDTSESEMEFDFDVSPPAATAKPQLAVKPRIVNMTTQTAKNDLNVNPMYPISVKPYFRAYDCAAGDRYTYTAYGTAGESAFEDGVFGNQGGGPHGVSNTFRGKIKRSRAGAGGPPVGQYIPYAKKRPGPTPFIPVRMPKRYVEALKREAQEKEDAIKAEIEKKKKGIDPMAYLMKKGIVKEPWNPNKAK